MTKKRNRAHKYIISLIATLIILLFIYTAVVLISKHASEADIQLSGPYEVVRVVDGDTIIVDVENEQTRIRLIGIDTPESVADETERNTPEGEEASNFLKDLLKGKTVYLEYDSELKDAYDRTLCYVYLNDGKTMVNELLLEKGYARTLTIEPNTKHESRLYDAEQSAKKNMTGFWGTGFFN